MEEYANTKALEKKVEELERMMIEKTDNDMIESNLHAIMQYVEKIKQDGERMKRERDETVKAMNYLVEEIKRLKDKVDGHHGNTYKNGVADGEGDDAEIPLAEADAKIISYIQIREMVCADDVKSLMNYRGRNAASARLNNLYRLYGGILLKRFQIGHKVYYKYAAGKSTKNILIVSPPQ